MPRESPYRNAKANELTFTSSTEPARGRREPYREINFTINFTRTVVVDGGPGHPF